MNETNPHHRTSRMYLMGYASQLLASPRYPLVRYLAFEGLYALKQEYAEIISIESDAVFEGKLRAFNERIMILSKCLMVAIEKTPDSKLLEMFGPDSRFELPDESNGL